MSKIKDMRNEEQFRLLEKLFDAKLQPLVGEIAELNKALNGNGKPGLITRVASLETFRTKIYAIYGVVVVLFFVIGVYIRGFIEALWRHVYGR